MSKLTAEQKLSNLCRLLLNTSRDEGGTLDVVSGIPVGDSQFITGIGFRNGLRYANLSKEQLERHIIEEGAVTTYSPER